MIAADLESDRAEWLEDAVATIIGLTLAQKFVTSEDLRREMRPASNTAWPGLAFSKARNRGFIKSVDTPDAKAYSSKTVWTTTGIDPDQQRFWTKVQKTETCWLWTASKLMGYGRFRYQGEITVAHRVAYMWLVGPIPEGLMLDHTCHNPGCVNPQHLRPVTSKQNQENRLPVVNQRLRGASKARGRWHATAKHHRRMHSAGYFDTKEEAAEAARQLRLSLYTHNDPDRNHK